MSASSPATICGLSRDDFLLKAEGFHGHVSPGVVMGGFLVNAAWDALGDTPYLNAVVESVVCLPDAVQILTPCTLGNGFMQVLDWGRFAITLYDRQSLTGYRARLAAEKVEQFPLIAGWYLRKSAGPVDKDDVVQELLDHGHQLVSMQKVALHRSLKDQTRYPTITCPDCGEMFPTRWGKKCLACQGEAYCDAV